VGKISGFPIDSVSSLGGLGYVPRIELAAMTTMSRAFADAGGGADDVLKLCPIHRRKSDE